MPAAFVLSLDTEIAWGTYTNLQARAPTFDRYPELLRRLTQQLDIYEISATWAIVGHLLLPEGTRTRVPQPQYSFADAPDSDRAYENAPHWFYGRYILDAIQQMRVPQELATHTFTHLLATDPAVDEDMFAAQLSEVVRVYTEHGLPAPRSLVYPQNRVAYTDVLPAHGIICYRGVAADWYARLPDGLKRPAHLLDRMFAFPPPTYAPQDCLQQDGLVNLPASQFLMSYDGVRARIPTRARVQQAHAGLKRAIANDEIYHLWFHPFNLGSSDEMFEALSQILSMVWLLRERGQVQVTTMGTLAERIRAGADV